MSKRKEMQDVDNGELREHIRQAKLVIEDARHNFLEAKSDLRTYQKDLQGFQNELKRRMKS